MNQVVFWLLFILGLFVWLMFRPYATAPWKILGAFGLLVAAHPLSVVALNASSRAHPLKYDYVLQAVDESLGITAFQVARLFTPRQTSALIVIYELLSAAMIAWYGVHLLLWEEESRKLLYSYLVLFVVGGILYGIVPALGPRYVFGDAFPVGHPSFVPTPAPIQGYPNAMPSLHVATAALLVLFARINRWLLIVSLLFLAGTIAATLRLEHYVIDLVVAIPFACFADEFAHKKFIRATGYMSVVLAWLLLIRFASPELIGHPYILRMLALLSVFPAAFCVATRWTVERQPDELLLVR